MKRRSALSLYVGLPGLWLLAGAPAMAADARCSRLDVQAGAHVESSWPGVSDRVHEAFDAREDTDSCAKVRLLKRQASIDLEVVLPDGRSARRSELQPEDLLPVLEGLLVLPERAANVATVSVARASAPSVATRPSQVDSDGELAVPRAAASADRSGLGFEISVATGARIGDGQMGVGIGASSMFEFANVLLGLAARLDSYAGTSGGPLTPALEFAAIGGYRFHSSGVAFSVFAGPAWTRLQTSSSSMAPVGTSMPMPDDVSETFTPRFCAGARVDLGMQSVLRTFLGIDAVIGPAGQTAFGVPPGAVQRLPEWMLGVALGATLGTI